MMTKYVDESSGEEFFGICLGDMKTVARVYWSDNYVMLRTYRTTFPIINPYAENPENPTTPQSFINFENIEAIEAMQSWLDSCKLKMLEINEKGKETV